MKKQRAKAAPTLHVDQFASMGALCAYIANTKQDGKWIWYGYYQSSLKTDGWTREIGDLDINLTRAQSLVGLEEPIGQLERLITQVTGHVPAPESIRRVRTWGRAGQSVSVHKVLRGDLGHAWRKMDRQARPAHSAILTLVLPGAVSSAVSSAQIAWTTAASLAYAALAEQAGYRCEIWHQAYAEGIYDTGASHVIWTCLKRADVPWSIQDVAVSIMPGFFRKLYFRVWETGAGRGFGVLDTSYGSAASAATLTQYTATWAAQGGHTNLRYGAHADDSITTQAQAVAWVQKHLHSLAA